MCRLEFPQLLQSRENPILQPDQPSTAGPFCLAIVPLSRGSFPQLPFDADSRPFPIEVLPLKADAFARTHPLVIATAKRVPYIVGNANFRNIFASMLVQRSQNRMRYRKQSVFHRGFLSDPAAARFLAAHWITTIMFRQSGRDELFKLIQPCDSQRTSNRPLADCSYPPASIYHGTFTTMMFLLPRK